MPRAAGIPVCSGGNGYKELNHHSRKFIDRAISEIRELLGTGRYKRLYFGLNEEGRFDASLDPPGDEVSEYIISELRKLGTPTG